MCSAQTSAAVTRETRYRDASFSWNIRVTRLDAISNNRRELSRYIPRSKNILFRIFAVAESAELSLGTLFLTFPLRSQPRDSTNYLFDLFALAYISMRAQHARDSYTVINALSTGVLFQLCNRIVFTAYCTSASSLALLTCDDTWLW